MIKELIKEAFGGFNGAEDVYTDFENGHAHELGELYLVMDGHDIERNEPVYMVLHKVEFEKGGWFSSDKEYHFSCCITEWGISFAGSIEPFNLDSEDPYCRISWDNIEKVILGQYNESISNFSGLYDFANNVYHIEKVIKIYNKNGGYVGVPMCYVSHYNGFVEAVNHFLELKNKYDEEQYKEDYSNRLEIQKLFEQNDYEGVLHIMEENNLWDSSGYYYQFRGINSLLGLNRKLEADRRFLAFEKNFLSIDEEEYRENNDNYDNLKNYYLLTKAIKEEYERKWYDASVTCSLIKELGIEDELTLKKGMEQNYTNYVQKFEMLPYQERKVITMTNTDHLFKSDHLTLLWMNNLPTEIKFPITHPKKDHTYICHPYDNRLYLPIEDYEEVLLNDRINEYCYLMQCLGATTIRIQNKKEESLNEDRESARNIHGEVSYKILEASGNYETNSKKGEGRNSKYTFAREQHFNPSKKPYIPDGLIWFPHEVSWQRLATQRMSGGILKYSESVSSSENRVVTSNELQDINAEIKVLFAKMKGGIKRESNYEISMNEDQEWEIFVEFKPIEEFDASMDFLDIAETVQIEEVEGLPESIFTEEEKQYMDEVRYMLEDDDKIDEKESRLLERFRQKFNLSEDRANELKNILLSAVDLNSQELEYLKEYETFIQDGEIKERERRLLNRVANLLGISEDRALEIENKYNIKNQ